MYPLNIHFSDGYICSRWPRSSVPFTLEVLLSFSKFLCDACLFCFCSTSMEQLIFDRNRNQYFTFTNWITIKEHKSIHTNSTKEHKRNSLKTALLFISSLEQNSFIKWIMLKGNNKYTTNASRPISTVLLNSLFVHAKRSECYWFLFQIRSFDLDRHQPYLIFQLIKRYIKDKINFSQKVF